MEQFVKTEELIHLTSRLLKEPKRGIYTVACEATLTHEDVRTIKGYATAYLKTKGRSFDGYMRPYGPVMRVLTAYDSVPPHREHDY